MATAPVPHTWSFLEDATSANLQTLTDAIAFLLSPPRCHVVMGADDSTVDSTFEVMSFDGTEVYDTHGMHSSVTNPSRIIAQHDGLFNFIIRLAWANNSTGRRRIMLRKNAAGSAVGGTAIGTWSGTPVSGVVSSVVAIQDIPLVTGDYIEVFAEQTSGGALAVNAGSSFAQARWVATS